MHKSSTNKSPEPAKGETKEGESSKRGKKRSFAGLFSGPSSKIAKNNEKLLLTNFQFLFYKSVEQQKKESLILMVKDINLVSETAIIDGKPFNFGMYDVNGITIEAVIFPKSEQLRFKSVLKENANESYFLVISGWSWFVNNSGFITSYMIHHKINIGRETEMRFVTKEDLVSTDIIAFKLGNSIERLFSEKCCNIVETCWLMVARPPQYFYNNYSGVLISDGTHFGIVAVVMTDEGDLKTDFKFLQDNIFKLKQVNAKILDVAHRKLSVTALSYFLLDTVLKPCVFYVDEYSTIINDNDANVEFGDTDENDIIYPEMSENISKTPINELFKALKLK